MIIVSAVFAFLHFFAAFGTAATLFVEWVTMNRALTYVEARRIQMADRWYGIFGGLLLVVGILRVFYFEKGKDFYFANAFFILKLVLFLVVLGGLSIYPTIKFIGWRKQTRQQLPPVVSDAEF